MKHTYHPNRGVKTDAVTKIIVNDLVRNKSVASSLQQFLEYNPSLPPPNRPTPSDLCRLAGIRNYLAKISKNENLKADFIKYVDSARPRALL